MLIGHAEDGGWCLAVINFTPSAGHLLAEAFSPELLEPERELPQGLRIRKQDENAFCPFPLEHELNERGHKGRILEESLACLCRRRARAVHEAVDIESHKRGRQRADR